MSIRSIITSWRPEPRVHSSLVRARRVRRAQSPHRPPSGPTAHARAHRRIILRRHQERGRQAPEAGQGSARIAPKVKQLEDRRTISTRRWPSWSRSSRKQRKSSTAPEAVERLEAAIRPPRRSLDHRAASPAPAARDRTRRPADAGSRAVADGVREAAGALSPPSGRSLQAGFFRIVPAASAQSPGKRCACPHVHELRPPRASSSPPPVRTTARRRRRWACSPRSRNGSGASATSSPSASASSRSRASRSTRTRCSSRTPSRCRCPWRT